MKFGYEQSIRSDFTIPPAVVRNYDEISVSYRNKKKWSDMGEERLWEELVLCILSSNVRYEMAKSAFQQLRYKRILREARLDPKKILARLIAKELQRPIYLPRKRDNGLRKYRFPNIRARNIVQSARFLYYKNNGLHRILDHFKSSRETRDFLATSIPGIGLKEASHFLRNIGYGDELAIIDVHIISFLKEMSLVNVIGGVNINERIYRRLESIMQNLAVSLNLSLAILDMAIWKYMRSK